MKKVILLSVMLVASMAISAQTKIVPQMKKGLKKVYATTATVSVGGQKDVKMSSETKYTVTEANADGYVVDMFDLELFTYPIFNLADCFVVVGWYASMIICTPSMKRSSPVCSSSSLLPSLRLYSW